MDAPRASHIALLLAAAAVALEPLALLGHDECAGSFSVPPDALEAAPGAASQPARVVEAGGPTRPPAHDPASCPWCAAGVSAAEPPCADGWYRRLPPVAGPRLALRRGRVARGVERGSSLARAPPSPAL